MSATDMPYVTSNSDSRDRLAATAASLTDEELQRTVSGGWTVAAVLAHLAFYDRFALARWDQYEREGALLDMPAGLVDLLNTAGAGDWLAVAPRRAVELALSAAEAVDERIQRLPEAAVEHALATDRRAMVNRGLHRNSHLDDIDGALRGS